MIRGAGPDIMYSLIITRGAAMKKYFTLIMLVIFATAGAGTGCKKKGSGMEDFSDALNMQYESYRIIKDNKNDPAKAGRLFTGYYKTNRDKMFDAFTRYYKRYGSGAGLSRQELAYLSAEMQKVHSLIADPEIKKVMDDPAFAENAGEGSRILSEIRSKSRESSLPSGKK
jgi:hypothetical protein